MLPLIFSISAARGALAFDVTEHRMGYHSRQTTHGLRRCASTILNETGLFEPDWVETQLAHAEQNKVRGAYNAALYLKYRRMMLQWWADFIDRQAAGLRVVA